MALYPIERIREVDRRWFLRREYAVVTARPSASRDRAHRLCPSCHALAPRAPVASLYLGAGLVEHDWQCTCGHAWSTSASSSKPGRLP